MLDPQAIFNVHGLTAVITAGSGQLGPVMAHALAQASVQIVVPVDGGFASFSGV